MNESLEARKAAVMKEKKERLILIVDSLRNKVILDSETESFGAEVAKVAGEIIRFGFMTAEQRESIRSFVAKDTFNAYQQAIELIYNKFKSE